MTKRGMPAAVVALAAMLAFAGTATAQKRDRLTYKVAKRLAVTLAEKQVRDRDIVSYHLRDPERLGRNRILFAYDDRSRDNVFCTAVVVVRRAVGIERTRIRARFRGQDCERIPAEALAVEAATRDVIRGLRGGEDATRASLRRVRRSIRRCRDLEVPRLRRTAAAAVLDIALTRAVFDPNEDVFGEFVGELLQVDATRPVLQRGILAWGVSVAAVREFPSFPDPCATLRRWAQADWAASESPVDVSEYRTLVRRIAAADRAIARAGRYLARVGVFPRVAKRFVVPGTIQVPQ